MCQNPPNPTKKLELQGVMPTKIWHQRVCKRVAFFCLCCFFGEGKDFVANEGNWVTCHAPHHLSFLNVYLHASFNEPKECPKLGIFMTRIPKLNLLEFSYNPLTLPHQTTPSVAQTSSTDGVASNPSDACAWVFSIASHVTSTSTPPTSPLPPPYMGVPHLLA